MTRPTPKHELYTEHASIPAHQFFIPNSDGPARQGPRGNKWSGKNPVPAVGDTVRVRINQIGEGRVCGYFTQHGYLGLLVQPHNPPDWYIKQNGRYSSCHVFGAELAE